MTELGNKLSSFHLASHLLRDGGILDDTFKRINDSTNQWCLPIIIAKRRTNRINRYGLKLSLRGSEGRPIANRANES